MVEHFIFNKLDYPVITAAMLVPAAGIFVLLLLRKPGLIRGVSLATTILAFIVSLPLYMGFDRTTYKAQFVERYSWLPSWNLYYTVGVDGISLPFILLITIISILCILVSWRTINERVRDFHICLLSMVTIMIGIFVSLDLFQFFIFWEAMLIPMFLLIGVWGGEDRIHAAVKFLLFTLGGSIFMLAGIVALFFLGGKTFDIYILSSTGFPLKTQLWLFAAFFAAFAVKIPLVPFHSWLPSAYREAPTAATVLMAAVLAKMGTYGFLRISFPLFPEASRLLIDPLIALSVVSIIYGAYLALAENDLKRLIAYSSLSHMGFIALGIFTLNKAGIEGGTLQMINHGVITGALFICAGIINERTQNMRIGDYGGLSKSVPMFAAVFTIFALAGSGFPGLNYFVGEFLILSGAFKASLLFASLSIFGVILSVAYLGWLYYRLILGEQNPETEGRLYDLSKREFLMLLPLVFITIYVGLQPQALLSFMDASVEHLIERLAADGQEIAGITNMAENAK